MLLVLFSYYTLYALLYTHALQPSFFLFSVARTRLQRLRNITFTILPRLTFELLSAHIKHHAPSDPQNEKFVKMPKRNLFQIVLSPLSQFVCLSLLYGAYSLLWSKLTAPLLPCDPERAIVAFHSAFLNVHRLKWCRYLQHYLSFDDPPKRGKAYSAVEFLRGWCHVQLLPSPRTFHAPVYSVVQSHGRRMHACLGVICHLQSVWRNYQDLLRTAAVTRGWNGYRNKSQPPFVHESGLTLSRCKLPAIRPVSVYTYRAQVHPATPLS